MPFLIAAITALLPNAQYIMFHHAVPLRPNRRTPFHAFTVEVCLN